MIDNVLLIDDDDVTLMICETVIEKEEFARNVSKCKNGLEGIEYFRKLENNPQKKDTPELILLDLNMPVMNGWEFLEEFEKKYEKIFPDVKVCILTSSVDPLDLTNSKIHENVIGFIHKPLTAERVNEIKENDKLAPFFEAH